MARFIALLRGINVGGQKLVRMEALRESFAALGAREISTYLQSGNVLFDSDGKAAALATEIERRLLADFGFEVGALV